MKQKLQNMLYEFGLIEPPKKSNTAKMLGLGLGGTLVALVAGNYAKGREPQ